MATNAAKDCNLCNEEYNEGERCPRSLPCSHCICSECVQNLITRNAKKCPFCLRNFQATSAKDIGINTALLDLLKYLKEMEECLLAPRSDKSTPPANTVRPHDLNRQTKELANGFVVRYVTAEEDIDNAIQEYSDLQDTLLKDLQSVQNKVMAKMKEMTSRTLKKVSYIESQKKILVNQKKSAVKNRNKIADAVRNLEASANYKDAGPVIDEVEDIISDSTKCLQKIDELIIEGAEKSRGIRKVTEVTKVNLQRILVILKSSDEEEEQLDLTVDLQLLETKDNTPQLITIESLRMRSRSVMELINARRLFAVQDFEGRRRFAHITLEENKRILISNLRAQIIPSDAHLLQYDEVIEMVNKDSVVSFMELSWEGSTKGRIHILLSPQTPLATQFWYLCMAHLGPSYLHTTFIQKHHDPFHRSFISGGDYDRGDGSGGAPIIKKHCNRSIIYCRDMKYGCVGTVDTLRNGPKSAQFKIYTWGFPGKFNGIFGQVVEGIDLIRAAYELDDVKKVRIEDCGIVLPF